MPQTINVDAIARALAGKRLGKGAYVDDNIRDREGRPCRCAAGELAHVAGVSDETLRTIDRWEGRVSGATSADEQAFQNACAALDVALRDAYGVTPEGRDYIVDANDHETSSTKRAAHVHQSSARVQRVNRHTEQQERPMTRVSCSWCHTMNDASASTCSNCGHNPTRPRMSCDCAQCSHPRPRGATSHRSRDGEGTDQR